MGTQLVAVRTDLRTGIIKDNIIKIRFMVSSITDMAKIRKQEYILNKCKHLDLEIDSLEKNVEDFM